jgi:hypothetical protein
VVTVAAALALLVAFAVAPPDLSGDVAAIAVTLAALAFLAQLAPIAVAAKRGIVLDTSVQMVALLVLSPGEAALVCAVAAALGNVYRGRAWFNSLFNAAQVTLAVLSAGTVYHLLAPPAADEPRTRPVAAGDALRRWCSSGGGTGGGWSDRDPARRPARPRLVAVTSPGVPAARRAGSNRHDSRRRSPGVAGAGAVAPVAALRAAAGVNRSDEEAMRVAEAMAAAVEGAPLARASRCDWPGSRRRSRGCVACLRRVSPGRARRPPPPRERRGVAVETAPAIDGAAGTLTIAGVTTMTAALIASVRAAASPMWCATTTGFDGPARRTAWRGSISLRPPASSSVRAW